MSLSTGGQGTTGPWSQAAGNDITVAFPFAHKIYDEDHLVILLTVDATSVTTVQTKTTHYTVSGVAADAHDTTTPTVTMVTAPATGETLTTYRKGTLTQLITLNEGTFWQGISLEQKLDLIAMDVQYLQLQLSRCAVGSLADVETTVTLEALLAAAGYTLINELTAKGSVVAADIMRIADSADSFAEKKITMAILKTFMMTDIVTTDFDIYDNGNSGASKTIDWSNGSFQKLTLTADCTITFSNPTNGRLQLDIIQDGTGGWNVTSWASSPKWANGGTAPTITATATTGNDIIAFYYDGTNYKGVPSQDFS